MNFLISLSLKVLKNFSMFLLNLFILPVILPLFSYHFLRKKYEFIPSILTTLLLFLLTSSVYFIALIALIALIAPFIMPTLAVSSTLILTLIFVCSFISGCLSASVVIMWNLWLDDDELNLPSEIPTRLSGVPREIRSQLFESMLFPSNSKELLSYVECTLIQQKRVEATRNSVHEQQKNQLNKLSNRYVLLKKKIDDIQVGLTTGTILEDYDDFNPHGDLHIPILCVKKYNKGEDWLTVPSVSHITDQEFLINWLIHGSVTHPLNRDSFLQPNVYIHEGVSYPTKYHFYKLSAQHCWAPELNESALEIRALLAQLDDQPTARLNATKDSVGLIGFFSSGGMENSTVTEQDEAHCMQGVITHSSSLP